MNYRTLGVLALAGAPCMCLGMAAEAFYPSLSDSWFTGVWGLIYLSAWMCSIVALKRMEATGNSPFGKMILPVLLGTLTAANISNVYQLFLPEDKSPLFWTLDLFWPLSNVLMLVVGITVIAAKRLTGWRRYVPLAAGLWLPYALITLQLLGRTTAGMVTGSVYSAIAWSVLAVAVLTSREPQPRPVSG